MKKLMLILILAGFLSCEQTNIYSKVSACGVDEPQKNLPWLVELIQKAQSDKTGNYLGEIWLEKYEGNDIFVTNMAMGSGGIAYYFFDCQGKSFEPTNINQFVAQMKLNTIIYSNIKK